MAQQLRAFLVLAVDPGLVPSTTAFQGDPIFYSDLLGTFSFWLHC